MSYNQETGMYEGYIYQIYNDVNDKLYIGQTITTLKERFHGHMSAAISENRSNSLLYKAMKAYGRENFHIKIIDTLYAQSKQEIIDKLNELEPIRIQEYHSMYYENGYNFEKGGNNKSVPGRIVHKYDINLNYLDTYESCEEAGRQNGIDGSTIYGCCKHYFYTAGGYVWAFDGECPVKPDYSKRTEALQRLAKSKKKEHRGKRHYKSVALPPDTKRSLRLQRLNWNGEKIYVYNAFGEIISIYEDLIDAIENIPITAQELKKNLSGENLKYKNFVIRYESDPFNKYPMSRNLQAITIYDMSGNIVDCFESIISAEKFVGCCRGEILKTIKRGGSYKNYMFSFYGQPLLRKVYQMNKHIDACDQLYNTIKSFDTLRQINDFLGVVDCHHGVNNAIKNKTQYKGYYWKYKDEFAVNA